MKKSGTQVTLQKYAEHGQHLLDEFSCQESRDMASKFVAQHNLASAHEGWTESKRRDENPKQEREITTQLDELI